MVLPSASMILRSAISNSLCSFVCCHDVSRVQGRTDGLHTGILGAVIIARCNNVAVKRAADLNAIFNDGGLSANLHRAIFKSLNAVNYDYFF